MLIGNQFSSIQFVLVDDAIVTALERIFNFKRLLELVMAIIYLNLLQAN